MAETQKDTRPGTWDWETLNQARAQARAQRQAELSQLCLRRVSKAIRRCLREHRPIRFYPPEEDGYEFCVGQIESCFNAAVKHLGVREKISREFHGDEWRFFVKPRDQAELARSKLQRTLLQASKDLEEIEFQLIWISWNKTLERLDRVESLSCPEGAD